MASCHSSEHTYRRVFPYTRDIVGESNDRYAQHKEGIHMQSRHGDPMHRYILRINMLGIRVHKEIIYTSQCIVAGLQVQT